MTCKTRAKRIGSTAIFVMVLWFVDSPIVAGSKSQLRHVAKPQSGVASIYGEREAGKLTANGTPLAPNHMTAASPTLPLGTKAKIINKRSGKSARVTITDRGPYAKGRILDVTPKAAKQLGITKKDGVAPVEVRPLSVPTDRQHVNRDPAPH